MPPAILFLKEEVFRRKSDKLMPMLADPLRWFSQRYLQEALNMLARDVWKNNKTEFVRRFGKLKAKGICRGLYLFGSVFHGDDDEQSDLDLLITLAPNTTFRDVSEVERKMQEGIDFKIHVNCVPDGFGDDMVAAQRAIKVA